MGVTRPDTETGNSGSNLYIVGVESGRRLDIQYIPLELAISRKPDITGVKIIGRNNPLYHYTGGEKTLRFSLDFHARTESRQDVIESCEWLEGLTYNDGISSPVETVRLVFGRLFQRNEVWAVLSVDYKLSQFNKARGLLPLQANVEITLGLANRKDFRKRDFI